MKQKYMVKIIIALLVLIEGIICTVIGAIWGKNNINVIVQIDGKNVVLEGNDAQELVDENEELKKQISNYVKQIEDFENENNELTTKLADVNGNLEEIPSIEFQNIGLFINGEERIINKEKSSVLINNLPYYSQDFVDNLLPDNMSLTVRDNTMYIGKIIKEKIDLFEQPIIEIDSEVFIYENVYDTYGNWHDIAVNFHYNNHYIVFNANMEYSKFKCVISMKEGYRSAATIQIEADDKIVYTSPEITSQTKPLEIDVPINMASKITIRSIGENGESGLLISEGVLYNEE